MSSLRRFQVGRVYQTLVFDKGKKARNSEPKNNAKSIENRTQTPLVASTRGLHKLCLHRSYLMNLNKLCFSDTMEFEFKD